ncbi:MAG: Protein phosphatase 2C 1 [Geoglossum simile]|nr:MAG: Protein phosphatase 2C 1 [Geoglossum simile]
MFGNSSSAIRDNETTRGVNAAHSPPSSKNAPTAAMEDSNSGDKRNNAGGTSGDGSNGEGAPSMEKKRRSSGIGTMFSSARLHLSGSSSGGTSEPIHQHAQTPMQKLGKTDPALNVPQGSNNNSAGESLPTPRSTFRVGVTEDKNKKCRRTMEDTHSYLYNFLNTPAPVVRTDTGSSTSKSSDSVSESTGVVETDNGYFAIFDGHAGTFAADWCGKKLHLILEETIRKNPNTPIPDLLDQTFTNVDQQLEKLPVKNSGCTAVAAVLRWEDRIPNPRSATGSTAIAPAAAAAAKAEAANAPKTDGSNHTTEQPQTPPKTSHTNSNNGTPPPVSSALSPPSQAKLQESATRQRVLYTANVGDARIVLCRNGKALRLSYDHKGSDENEGKRVTNAGGLILNNRVNGVLAVTRALGDSYMKDLVIGHPYTTETVIQPEIDEFIILACDGLWDVCSDQEAVDLIRYNNDPQDASKVLVDHALARFSTDNLSCMIVRFDNRAVQNTVDHKVELIGVEGDQPGKRGGISEAEAIVREAKAKASGESAESRPIDFEAAKGVDHAADGQADPESSPDTEMTQ